MSTQSLAEILAVLDAAVASRDVARVEALAASPDRAVAKAARRALYQLRSAGVAARAPVPEPPPPAPEPDAPLSLPSLRSPPDGTGEFLLMVARPVKGGLAVHEVVVSDELGLLAHVELETSRGAWRRSLREARGKPVEEISLEDARALLAEGVRCNLATRTPLPQGAEAMLRRLAVEPAASLPPPLPPPEDGDAALALEAADLHHEPELRSWLPPEPELRVLAARVNEVQAGVLALSEQQRAEQLTERVRAMAEAFFTEERSRLYARRLWVTADFFQRSGRTHAAQVARAEARLLSHGRSGVFSRFAEALYGKLVQLAPAPAAAGTAATPPVAPAGAVKAPAERRTPGGLILP
jgi:hypothetical protein